MTTLDSLSRAVLELKKAEVIRLAELALAEGIPAERAIAEGLAAGMRLVGDRFAKKEYFVPEVLVAGRALNAGMAVLAPHVTRSGESGGTVVLAVVEGDFHDIGKNILRLMADAGGLKVVDLGKNVPADEIEEAARAENADVVGLSTLMTTTLEAMEATVAQVRDRTGVPVLVGGAAVTPSFAERIGAAGTAPDAATAVELLRSTIAGVRA